MSTRQAGGGHGHGDPGASQPPSYVWKTPAGWEEYKGSSMRAASWRVSGHAQTDCSLTMLPKAGGGVVSNVNRWRGEMGLDALDAAAVAKLPRKKLLGATGTYIDLSGDFSGGRGTGGPVKNARMLGIVAEGASAAVFLKFAGPADVVGKEQKHFEELAASLAFKPSAAARPPAGGSSAGPTTWQVPEGWVEQPKKMMRVVTLVPKDLPDAWCYASVVGGGMVPNLNRWRGEMGQAGLTEMQIAQLPKFQVLGKPSVLLEVTGDFAGTGGPPLKGAKMLGVVCPLGGRDLFIKMVGPADKLDTQRERFLEFCKSMK